MAPVNESRASSSPLHDLGLDADARAHAVDELVAVLRVARRRRRDEADVLRAELADRRGVAVARGERALERLGREPSGPVDALPEPHDLHLAVRSTSVPVPASTSATSSRMELVPQSIAATRVVTTRSSRVHGPAAPQSGSSASASSPNGFTPGPAASAWPTSTCRHFTRSGMPPAVMPSISVDVLDRLARRRGSPRARRGRPRASSGSVGEPVLHLAHRAAGLERADEARGARAGQVVERRERRAVGQPRLGLDDVRVTARAAVRDRADAARLAAELATDRGEVVARRVRTTASSRRVRPHRDRGRT